MNMFQAMSAMQNPQGYLMQMGFQQLVRENPAEWNKCQQMFAGKPRDEQVRSLRKLYEERSMDLDAMAKQYGVNL